MNIDFMTVQLNVKLGKRKFENKKSWRAEELMIAIGAMAMFCLTAIFPVLVISDNYQSRRNNNQPDEAMMMFSITVC